MADTTLHLLTLYVLTELVACLSPGPAVLTVAGQALAGSRRGAAGAIVGINIGNLIWYALAGAGLSAIEAAMPHLFVALRWVGVAYLLWIGVRSWRSRGSAPRFQAARNRSSFGRGLVAAAAVQLSNPKALLFFTVLLPPFIDQHQPILPQIAMLSAIGVAIESTILLGYAALALRLGRFAADRGATRAIDRASGAMMIASALGIASMGLARP